MEEQQQCVFCHIANGQIPAKKVYEDDKVVCVLDINPGAPGHVLLLTKQHVAIMPQMDDELAGHVGMVSKQVSQSLIRALKVEGTSIFVANGAVAGQRAPHFMLHIIPRKSGDGINLQLQGKQLDEATMKDLFNKLAGPISKQFNIEMPSLETAKEPEKEEPKGEKKEQPEQEEKKEPEKQPEQEAPGKGPEEEKEESSLDDIADFLTK